MRSSSKLFHRDSSCDAKQDGDRRVTLRDIAERAQVSHATVSMALRNVGRISPERRKRIRDIAEEMGYRPDPILNAALALYKRGRPKPFLGGLAWLCCWDPPASIFEYEEFRGYWAGASSHARRLGYQLESFAPSMDMSLRRLDQILQARNIRGILVPPAPPGHWRGRLVEFPWERYAAVKFGYSIDALALDLVTSAHCVNAQRAVRAIAERGYRRIGFVTVDLARRTQVLAGVLRAQADLPASDRVPFLDLSERFDAGDLDRLHDWLRLHRPDSIFSNVREIRIMLERVGYRVPDDVALAVGSVADGCADAGIDQHPQEIGRTAAEMLITQLNHGKTGFPTHPCEQLVEGSWRDGSTLPTRNGATPSSKREFAASCTAPGGPQRSTMRTMPPNYSPPSIRVS